MARPLAPRGQGRQRVIGAALELFGEHGVSGTSLQMIADRLGVTKAAVYYQFHAKEDIVLAVVESAFEDMRSFLADAEAQPSADEAGWTALRGFVDLMIEHRRVVAALDRDPEVARIVETHRDFQSVTDRLVRLLLGPDPDTRRRITVSVIGAGVARAGIDPLITDVAEATLRAELLRLGCSLLGLPEPGTRG